MKSKGIIITGASGYLGSKLLNDLDKDSIILLNRDSFLFDKPVFYNSRNEKLNNIELLYKEFKLIHLATHYSQKTNHNEKIQEANLIFSQNVLNSVENLNITKIIYTNTMFCFYKDPKVRNLYYTKTKQEFSQKLWQHSKTFGYIVDEIFLDNNFGGYDSRKKIIQKIVESVLSKKDSPVINKNQFINLLHHKYVIQRIISSLSDNISGRSCLINNESINLESIYKFLLHYDQTKIRDHSILRLKANEYSKNFKTELFINNVSSEIDKELAQYLESKAKLL